MGSTPRDRRVARLLRRRLILQRQLKRLDGQIARVHIARMTGRAR